ncbi:MAG: two-component system NarL family sensor kinase [Flavobacteriaceae bacterium]|jgi:two-component system NarL family sensor kinase
MLSVRYWIVLLVSTLIVLSVLALSVFSYQEFREALDERVLLQLTSIKRLKRVQIEEYLLSEYEEFTQNRSGTEVLSLPLSMLQSDTLHTSLGLDENCFKQIMLPQEQGFLDLTACDLNGEVCVMIYFKSTDNVYFKEVSMDRIQTILLERSGMGQSGETYLVGQDFRLRSLSRFFPDQAPSTIEAKTIGVTNALRSVYGMGKFPDYRGVPVYSAYHQLDIPTLPWAILSEMDVSEVISPLITMRNKLIIIAIFVIIAALIFTLFLTSILSRPLLRMRDLLINMSNGEFQVRVDTSKSATEIKEMFAALNQLKQSIQGAITFSSEIGRMNLETKYIPKGERDLLGKSLVLMQQKLIAYEQMEERNRLLGKRNLIKGQENERERIAKELHDGIGPLLTSLRLSIHSASLPATEKEAVKGLLDKTIEDVRRVTYDLMPLGLMEFGAGKALAAFVNQVSKALSIELLFTYEQNVHGKRLPEEIDICVYRIGQELINNGLKHAKAKRITLSLTEFEDRVSLFYTDDGIGFTPEEVEIHSGLRNIQARAEVFRGTIVFSRESVGTEIEVEIPLSND